MNIINRHKHLPIVVLILAVVFAGSCSDRKFVSTDQLKRLKNYTYSDNENIAAMFSDEESINQGVQPALTRTELDILDALVDKISPEVRQDFDRKYTTWLNCWAPLDTIVYSEDIHYSLKCNGTEFQELITFCRQQNEDVLLLLYQIAVRAQCPYDRFLLHPVYELMGSFPEFEQYWVEANAALQKEKPDSTDRVCNEPTIWYTRKILESKYGCTYTGGLAVLFDSRKIVTNRSK